jgi:hypothetical protein
VKSSRCKQLFLQQNYKIPEDTIARNARKLFSVQKQLELFKSDSNKLADEVTLLRTSNSALRDQLSSVQDNAKLVVSLQEQLDSATAKNSTDQIAASITSFNCQRAEATAQSLQLRLDDKIASENLLRDQCETLSTERDALLGTLNEVRSRFAWDLPAFQPAADDFVSTSQHFLDDLSVRFFPPGSTPDSRLVWLEVELDELRVRAANIE